MVTKPRPTRAPKGETALAKAEYEALAAFRYTLRRFLDFSQAAAETAGLTAQQHQALLAIKGYPGRDVISVGELAERLVIRHNSGVELIDRLAGQGLVERRHDEADRRLVLLALTPKAEGLLAELSATHRDELRRLRPTLAGLLDQL